MKRFKGKVVSDKMTKAAVVEVVFVKSHPIYQKRIKVKRKIHAQNELGAQVGDQVYLTECRPISKTISYKITEVLK